MESVAPPRKRARTGSVSAQDTSAAEEIEGRFVQLLEKYPEGVKEDVLKAELADVDLLKRASTINSLLSRGRLTLGTIAGQIVYKLLATEDAAKLRGLDPNEVILYRIIEKEQHKGIWIRDLRRRSNLQQGKLQKLLKSLMSRKLIKSVKSVQRKQKVLMLYELEPAEELTGGAWYNGSEFDELCVQILRETCLKYITQRRQGTAEELHDFVRKSGIAKVQLAVKDIHAILLSLTYDGLVEELPSKGLISYQDSGNSSSSSGSSGSVSGDVNSSVRSSSFSSSIISLARSSSMSLDDSSGSSDKFTTPYRLSKAGSSESRYTHVPCTVCPVSTKCFPGNAISPTSCPYLQKWLDMD